MHKYDDALVRCEQALEIFHKLNDPSGEIIALKGIGLVYDNLGEFNKATNLYKDALKIAKKTGAIRLEKGIRLMLNLSRQIYQEGGWNKD